MAECILKNEGGQGMATSPSKGDEIAIINMEELVYKAYDHIIKHKNIPEELIKLSQWCYWKIEEKETGKIKKFPVIKNPAKVLPMQMSQKKALGEALWVFTEALAFQLMALVPGFMLSEDDPYCLT